MFKKNFAIVLFIGAGLFSCSSKKTENNENKGVEYTSTYVCPMHCEGSGSETEGTCPKCGMDYVQSEKSKKK